MFHLLVTCKFANVCDGTKSLPSGPYSLTQEPQLELSTFLVDQGGLPDPSLGSITLNWFPPQGELGRAEGMGAWLCQLRACFVHTCA